MMLTWMAEELRAAGLVVREDPGWEGRGSSWSPDGVMVHHTAPPVPFPIGGLNGSQDGRIKCNLNVKPDGTVWTIAAGACNYSSGGGSGVVLQETRSGKPPSGTAAQRGLSDTTSGNPHYINIEVDHRGDGSPLPDAAYNALVTACVVLVRYLEWAPARIITHAEWTRRKIDSLWNGHPDAHQAAWEIRNDVIDELIGPSVVTAQVLAIGHEGQAVTRAQRWMAKSPQAENLAPYLEALTDGVYDQAMYTCVTEYQRRRGLHVTGAVDGVTYADMAIWR